MLLNRKYIGMVLGLLLLLIALPGCEERIDPEEGKTMYDEANKPFYNLMKEWYLWYDEMPEIDPTNFKDPGKILDSLRVPKDRWSYITTVEEFEQYYEQGAYIGYGYGQKWDEQNNLRISFVFDDSPLKAKNIKRGWIIREINGTSINPNVNVTSLMGPAETGVENDFLLESPSGEIVDTTFAKEEISVNTVLHSSIIDTNGSRIGYLVLNSFIEKTSDELYQAFQELTRQNIDDIIIDLRYNGGGMLSKAKETADYVIGQGDIGSIFAQLLHNDKKEDMNTYHKFEEDSLSLALNLSRIYFITTQATASASEALINGLKPFMDVYLVGTDTHGKPVGMYAFYDNQRHYAFLPVCFRVANANEESDYYTGLPADAEVADDLSERFGSSEEDCLEQALFHIENGYFLTTKSVKTSSYNKVEYKSLKDLIGAQ
jgi:C-terminal processing protease CtpA/Prc